MTAAMHAPRDIDLSYRDTRALARFERRLRAQGRVAPGKRVDLERVRDPFDRSKRMDEAWGAIALWMLASAALHVCLAVLGALVPSGPNSASLSYERAVEIVEPPPPPPPPPPPEVTPELPPQPTQPIVPTLKPVPVQKSDPPPDPTEAPRPDPVPDRPVHRVVGLSLDSTVQGGSGVSFGVGNTRMGETSRVAEVPSNVGAGSSGPEFTPPRRTREIQPDYPSALRAQGIEGEVGLRVGVDASGRVSNVEVTRPSPHEEFNRAAVAAASRGAYQPATLNGVAVPNTIEFTVRFRLR